MNNRHGRNARYYAPERYRDPRDDRYSEDRFGDDYRLRSPEQEFETSSPYRQPADESWRRDPRAEHDANIDRQGFAPSPYVPRGFGAPARHEPPRGGYAGRGPKGYQRSDERLCEEVCERLSWNDEVDATDIAVKVSSGEVILEGSVETRHMKRLAEDIAEEVPGIIDVHNTLRITKPLLTELKEKVTGEDRENHYANTGTKTRSTTSPAGARNGMP